MQNQQDIQNVKTWQAPELIELGDISSNTQNNLAGLNSDNTTIGS
jgi:hypothetical protein